MYAGLSQGQGADQGAHEGTPVATMPLPEGCFAHPVLFVYSPSHTCTFCMFILCYVLYM